MRKRLDVIICEREIARSRERAKELILGGKVYVGQNISVKPGMLFDEGVDIQVKDNLDSYVSRAGEKLFKALKVFNIKLDGCVAMDVGASTGGFTDCMLKNGCRKVYAIDVGTGQLSDKLISDSRVKNLEGENIRYLNSDLIDLPVEFFSVDVSFISLCLVLPRIYEIVEDGAYGVCLIKPQFEAGRGKIGKRGVVKDKKEHIRVIEKICGACTQTGFNVLGLDYSPIKGSKGNIEYLIYIRKCDSNLIDKDIDFKKIVEMSYNDLNHGER